MEKLNSYYKLCKIELGPELRPLVGQLAISSLFNTKQIGHYFKKVTINGKDVALLNEQVVGAGRGPCLVL
jgi:hypothetical protein